MTKNAKDWKENKWQAKKLEKILEKIETIFSIISTSISIQKGQNGYISISISISIQKGQKGYISISISINGLQP